MYAENKSTVPRYHVFLELEGMEEQDLLSEDQKTMVRNIGICKLARHSSHGCRYNIIFFMKLAEIAITVPAIVRSLDYGTLLFVTTIRLTVEISF